MSAVIIEHVKVGDLPEAWRDRLAKPADTRVTVRIEEETGRQETDATRLKAGEAIQDPAFGIWRDRGGKSGTEDLHTASSGFRPFQQDLVCVRLQPFPRPEAGLE